MTRHMLELVGPEGFVAGLDVDPAMLAVAGSVSPTSIEWHKCSRSAIPCPDASFDVVTCSLGLQFVPDRSAAMREIRRVLADGGPLAIGTVQPPMPPVFEILAQALARHVKPEVAAFIRQVFSLHEPPELHALAEGAGLRSVSVESKALRIMLPPPSEFLWQYVTSTPLAGPVGEIGDDDRAALEPVVRTTAWRTFLDGDALRLDIDAVSAAAPGSDPRKPDGAERTGAVPCQLRRGVRLRAGRGTAGVSETAHRAREPRPGREAFVT